MQRNYHGNAFKAYGIGIGIFNDNIDENQTTTNHDELQDQGMSP